MDDSDPVRSNAIPDQDVSDGAGNGDDTLGPRPEAGPMEMEIDPPRRDKFATGRSSREPGQDEGVGIVGMKDGWSAVRFAEKREQDTRVKRRAPAGFADSDLSLFEAKR